MRLNHQQKVLREKYVGQGNNRYQALGRQWLDVSQEGNGDNGGWVTGIVVRDYGQGRV